MMRKNARPPHNLQAHQPKAWVNRCGYHLYDVLTDGVLDLARLLVGSEGTLALITQATLKTVPIPKYRGVALLFFDKLESAAVAAGEAQSLGLAACDLMDRRILSLARDVDERYARAIPREAYERFSMIGICFFTFVIGPRLIGEREAAKLGSDLGFWFVVYLVLVVAVVIAREVRARRQK